ncbi:MAG: reprolysin-like metallopeptidase [Saprospiraceae bacterium]
MNKLFTLLTLAFFFSTTLTAQNTNFWSDVIESEIEKNGTRQIVPLQYRTVKLDIVGLKRRLATAPMENNAAKSTLQLSFPMPDGTTQIFNIVESPIMEAGLAAQLPEIKTYLGIGADDPTVRVRFDWTYKGFHAMIMATDGWTFIDPYHTATTEAYISYYKKHFVTSKTKQCEFDSEIHGVNYDDDKPILNTNSRQIGEQLRTYRLALACTGEYAQFHGGTINNTASAIVTTINRVNGIYENEVAVRLILVANNNSLIFLDADTDPFSNNNTGVLVIQSHAQISNIIGTSNFDIGHTFSTGAGGLASLRSVCHNNQKGRGVTGVPQPVGDPFDIDYVAHEIGHQFGGNHTFNGSSGLCAGLNRNASTAFEPGSGSTIQAYAGICGAQNIQSNSDAYFHTASFDEIITYTHAGTGNNCPVITNTGNSAPIVYTGIGGFFIPKSTPFELIGNATDPDGNPMTYCWEQSDLGPQGSPNSPNGNAPLFRSFSPVSIPSRTFPQISDIINNTQTIGELLPNYARTLEFRLTARDNQPAGGGVSYNVINFNVTNQAGPFLVTSPNSGNEVWIEGSMAKINWDVANTDLLPINANEVDILLSTDGGFTYDYTLATNVPNTGHFNVTIPIGSNTNQARIRVQASNNIFFDISNEDFTIESPSTPDYSLFSLESEKTVCGGTNATYEFLVISLLNYTDEVTLIATNLPDGVTAIFSSNPAIPGETVTVTLTGTENPPTSLYPIEIQGNSNSSNQNFFVDLIIYSSTPSVATNLLPSDGQINTSTSPQLIWNTPKNLTHTYEVRVATNPDFTDIVVSTTNITDTSLFLTNLNPFTVYYWQIKASNNCIAGDWSSITAFRTTASTCDLITGGQQRNIIANAIFTYNSNLVVNQDVEIIDINIIDATISHQNISDISFGLKSPEGTEIELMPQSCTNVNGTAGWVLSFDDESTLASPICANTVNTTIQPVENLAIFNGENAQGTWQMQVTDNTFGNSGTFQTYSLEICYAATNDNEDPILVNNEILNIEIGNTASINTELLLSTDADNTAADLVYTLISTTTKGTLSLNGITLNQGNTFTQVDIDNGDLTYEHEGTEAETDQFQFEVRDGEGGWLGTPYFSIKVDEDSTGIATVDNPFGIYPNPSMDNVNVDFYLTTDQDVTIFVFDAIGKRIREYQYSNALQGNNIFTLNVSDLASGSYLLHFISDDFVRTEKILVIK